MTLSFVIFVIRHHFLPKIRWFAARHINNMFVKKMAKMLWI